eukprot:scaffold10570_cov176-Amphora_coffeaeformis.AAC.44
MCTFSALAKAKKEEGQVLYDEGCKDHKAVNDDIDAAVAIFKQAKGEHELALFHYKQRMDDAKLKQEEGRKMIAEAESSLAKYMEQETLTRSKMLVVVGIFNSMDKTSVFRFASMDIKEIKKSLGWEKITDLDEIPDNEWMEFKNTMVDLGLDENPFAEENGIALVRSNLSVDEAKSMVALALDISTDLPSPEAANKRLVEEMDDDSSDESDMQRTAKKAKIICLSNVDDHTSSPFARKISRSLLKSAVPSWWIAKARRAKTFVLGIGYNRVILFRYGTRRSTGRCWKGWTRAR